MMETSGWPKHQNRCCHRIGSPPFEGSKNVAPNRRSSSSMISAAVIAGNAYRIRTDVVRIDQQKTGIRSRPMPGARRVTIVATKFTAPKIEATPVRTSPTIHRSVPVVVEYGSVELGG